jgi:hypothetical protein
LGPSVAAAAPVAQLPLRRPDRFRSDLKHAEQPGQLALRQLARWTIVTRTAPFIPVTIIQSNQRLDQRHAADAIDPSRLEHGSNIGEQHDTGILVRAIGAELDCGASRILAVPEIISDGEQHAPIVGRAVVERWRHFGITRERTHRGPLPDFLARGGEDGSVLVEPLDLAFTWCMPPHVDHHCAVQERQRQRPYRCHRERSEGWKSS